MIRLPVADDTDTDGDTLLVSGVWNASGGVVLAGGIITFTPAADQCGAGSFDYEISDGNGGSDTGHAAVDLSCENDGPAAIDDTTSGPRTCRDDVTADLLANDSDIDGDTLTVSGVSSPTGGSVILDGGISPLPPTADLCGDAAGSFDYVLSDGNGGTDNASVTVDVTCAGEAPLANDDTVTIDEDITATDVTAQLLANDTDADLGTPWWSATSRTPQAAASSWPAGIVTFTPTADECGDGFGSFRLRDQRRQRWQRQRPARPSTSPARTTHRWRPMTRAVSRAAPGRPTSTSWPMTRTLTATP